MSLQSERLLAHMQRLRLTHLAQCYEALAEEAAQKNECSPANGFWLEGEIPIHDYA